MKACKIRWYNFNFYYIVIISLYHAGLQKNQINEKKMNQKHNYSLRFIYLSKIHEKKNNKFIRWDKDDVGPIS